MNSNNLCAVIVTYHPDAGFADRFARIARQVAGVVIVDNHSGAEIVQRLRQLPATLIANDDNLGVATALNQGCRWAAEQGYQYALLFDQDTLADENLTTSLLRLTDDDVALVGANYRDVLGHTPRPTTDAVITSGSLLSLAAYQAIGPFRDDFFIDSVDIEYCLRARTKGYRIVQSIEQLMTHSIGHQTRHRFLWKEVTCSNHSPLRRYYITRNRLLLAREYISTQPRWVFHHLRGLFNHCVLAMLYEKQRSCKLRAIVLGFWHAIINRRGRLERGCWTKQTHHD